MIAFFVSNKVPRWPMAPPLTAATQHPEPSLTIETSWEGRLLEARHARTLDGMADHNAIQELFAKYGGLEMAQPAWLAQRLTVLAEGAAKELRRQR